MPSSLIGTKASKASARKPHNLLPKLSFLLLAVAGYLSIPGKQKETDPIAQNLLERGWHPIETLQCEALQEATFWEVAGESGVAEAYVSEEGSLFLSTPQMPEVPYECRAIQTPTFIQEIP